MTNVSTASLESALPTTKSASTLLAPEEIFAPASADLRARSEYTPKEKQALRNKLKRKRKNFRDVLEKSTARVATINGPRKGKVAAEKAEALNRLKKVKGVIIDGEKQKAPRKGRTRS
jgi:U3 small nucleolar RNA-associated protein MPP10